MIKYTLDSILADIEASRFHLTDPNTIKEAVASSATHKEKVLVAQLYLFKLRSNEALHLWKMFCRAGIVEHGAVFPDLVANKAEEPSPESTLLH